MSRDPEKKSNERQETPYWAIKSDPSQCEEPKKQSFRIILSSNVWLCLLRSMREVRNDIYLPLLTCTESFLTIKSNLNLWFPLMLSNGKLTFRKRWVGLSSGRNFEIKRRANLCIFQILASCLHCAMAHFTNVFKSRSDYSFVCNYLFLNSRISHIPI